MHMKILIIEDDHFYAVRLTELLSDNGLETSVAGSVQQALGMPLEPFGFVISDVMLPNDPAVSGISPEAVRGGFFSGVALCREIKKRSHKIPIILLSSGTVGRHASEWV